MRLSSTCQEAQDRDLELLTSGNLTLEILAFSGSSLSLPTQDWNSGLFSSASSAGFMRYTKSNAFLPHQACLLSDRFFSRQRWVMSQRPQL